MQIKCCNIPIDSNPNEIDYNIQIEYEPNNLRSTKNAHVFPRKLEGFHEKYKNLSVMNLHHNYFTQRRMAVVQISSYKCRLCYQPSIPMGEKSTCL